MPTQNDSRSFYFFDFDDNIMYLDTPIFIRNTVTHEIRKLSTGEFANVSPHLGLPGEWQDYAMFEGSYANFRDLPPSQQAAGQKPCFVQDVETALQSPEQDWKGPSWDLFYYACAKERPVSLITARGHEPETLKSGIRVLVEKGLLPKEPNYHTLYPVSNERVRREQLDDTTLSLTTPALKKRAICQSVTRALDIYGAAPAHRFGMSDDDPQNVHLIISAMCECKKKYADKRFFVINTHHGEMVKLEVFPVDFPVVGHPDAEYREPLQ
jgi:hypothetical protein